MQRIYFIHKNNSFAPIHYSCSHSSIEFTLWSQKKHKIKHFAEFGEYLDNSYRIHKDYLVFDCEYEPHTI